MDKARKQRISGLIVLVLLFAAYVGWRERPQILLHYDASGTAPVSYSFKENGQETLAGEIQPGGVLSFPLRLWRSGGYRVSFTFHRGEEKYASFSSRPGYEKSDLYLGAGLEVSTQPAPPGMLHTQ